MCLRNFFSVDVYNIKKKKNEVEGRNTKEKQLQKKNKDQCRFNFFIMSPQNTIQFSWI